MNNTPLIAVICTLDSHADVRPDIIDDILAQTLKPHQLIIAYDASWARTIVVLQNHIKESLPTLQLQCIASGGTTIAHFRNIGLNHLSDCYYIHFVDAGIRIAKDFYEKASRGLRQHSDCVAAVAARLKLTNPKQTEIDLSGLVENPWLWLMQSKLEIASTILLRNDAVEKAGKFNPLLMLGADTDFFARISKQGRWHYISDCVVTYSQPQVTADLLSQFPDYHRRWALVYENLLDTYNARDKIARRIYRSLLATAWYRAGRELLNHHRIEEARDCFMRSLSWRMINPSLKYVMKISRLRKTTRIS